MARRDKPRSRPEAVAPAAAAAPAYARFLPYLPLLLTLLVWGRSVGLPIVYWDDTQYIFDDARVQELSLASLARIFSESYFSNYHPLTTLTYAVDHALFGAWMPGFHLTHLAFYAAGIFVLFHLSARLLGGRGAALIATCLYAVHTIHVEPVVWLAQRKDVVCLLFYAAALLAHARYRDAAAPRRRDYFLVLALGAAAMLAKGYAVVLPVLLVLWDLCFTSRSWRRAAVTQLPLAAVALAVTLATVASQDSALAETDTSSLSVAARLVLLAKIFAVYAARALVPLGLSVHYPVGADWLAPPVALLGAALAVALAVAFVRLRRSQPAIAFGVALYILPLGTVMNLFWTLPTWINDRYLFFPTIGSSVALVAAAGWLAARRPELRRTLGAAAGIALLAYALLTQARMQVWSSEVDLWSDAARKELDLAGSGALSAAELPRAVPPSAQRSVVFLAKAYARRGDQAAASSVLARLGSRPLLDGLSFTDVETLARDAIVGRRFDDALRLAERAAEVSPSRAWRAKMIVGLAHEERGDHAAARGAYEAALAGARGRGENATSALLALGSLDYHAGDFRAAAARYDEAERGALEGDPRPPFYLGLAIEQLGEVERAYRLYERALAMQGSVHPSVQLDFADVRMQLGVAAEKLGRTREALGHLERVLADAPKHPQHVSIRLKIGQLAEALGDPSRAIAEYREALASAPNHPDREAIRARIELLGKRQ